MENNSMPPASVMEFFEDYPKLHVISYTDSGNMILAMSPTTGKAHFVYTVNDDVSFHFNALWDVSRPYRDWFTETLESLNLGLVEVETVNTFYEKIVRLPKPEKPTLRDIFIEMDNLGLG